MLTCVNLFYSGEKFKVSTCVNLLCFSGSEYLCFLAF